MAKKIWEYDRMYDICRYYVDLCTRTQFASVKLSGLENIPKDGAVIFAPNHVAALMDPMIMMLTTHDAIGFGARSDIFKKPMIAKFLNWCKILPLARERNGLHEVAKNFQTMDEIVDCLKHGVPFCMYGEGMHRAEKGLLPIKKGIFRIARKALDELDCPVYVLPVGVDYEYFFRVQGRVSLQMGEPIDIGAYMKANADKNDAEIYSDLCSTLHSKILDLLDHIPERRHNMRFPRALALLMLLPIWLVFAIISFPIWLPSEIILSNFKDKAWKQTIYFAVRFFQPLLWPFFMVHATMGNWYKNLVLDLR